MRTSRSTFAGVSGLALLVSGSLAVATPALAQDDEADGAPMIDRVRVTALKREQDETDVPVSLTTFSTQDLINTRGRTLEGIEQLTPNFSFEGSGTFPNLTIRGIGDGGRVVGFSTRAGAYLDGVYVGQPPALPLPLLDVERVEILRGPQGNLYGRNTVSGAVNMVTRLPGSEPEGRFLIGAGNYGSFEAQGYFGGPIVPGRVFAGLSAGYEEREGYTTNVFNDSDLDGLERVAVRGAFSVDFTEAWSATVRADYSQTETTNVVGEPLEPILQGVPIPGAGGVTVDQLLDFQQQPERNVRFDTDPLNEVEAYGISLSNDFETQNGWVLRSITAFRNAEQMRVNDLDYLPQEYLFLNYNDEFEQFTQEVQVLTPEDHALRGIFGLFYFDETADSGRTVFVGEAMDDPLPLVGAPLGLILANPNTGIPIVPGDSTPTTSSIDTQSIAAFFSLDYDVTDRWTVTGGGRFTSEEKDQTYFIDGTSSGAFQNVTPTELAGLEQLGVIELSDDGAILDDFDDEQFTWSVSSVFNLNEDVNVFGRVATGFKSGGFNVDFVNAGQVQLGLGFDSETVISYEGGFKGFVLNDRVRFDITGFFAEYEDFQIDQFVEIAPGITVSNLTNAAEVETFGLEASFDARASDNFVFGGSFGYLDTEFVDYVSTIPLPGSSDIEIVDLSGNEVPEAPEFSGAVFGTYTMPVAFLRGDLEFYGEYSFQDESFATAENDIILDARSLVNARISYRPNQGIWEISAYGNNIFDEDYVESAGRDFFQNRIQRFGAPAFYGAELTVEF